MRHNNYESLSIQKQQLPAKNSVPRQKEPMKQEWKGYIKLFFFGLETSGRKYKN